MTQKTDEQKLRELVETQPVDVILALAESCCAIAAAQFAAGRVPDAEEQAILDRALKAHPNP